MWWILTIVGWAFVLVLLVANRRIKRNRDTLRQKWAESETKLIADRDRWRDVAGTTGDQALTMSAAYNAARVELEKIAQIASQAIGARAD